MTSADVTLPVHISTAGTAERCPAALSVVLGPAVAVASCKGVSEQCLMCHIYRIYNTFYCLSHLI